MTVSAYSSSYTTQMQQSQMNTRQQPDFEAMANEMISSMDSDSDGAISSEEFVTALGSSTDMESEDAAALYSQLDSDASGALSTEELMAALKSMGPPPREGGMPPPPPPEPQSSEDSELDTTEIFSALDSNGDGSISQEEFDALFAATEDTTTSTTTESATASDESDNDVRSFYDKMLQQLVAYYGNQNYNDTTSALSVSA